MSSIFLSHNSDDKPFVRRLAADLQDHGVRVWVDEAEMNVGMSLIEVISKAIDEMEYLGVVLSPSSVGSAWVQFELRQALYKEVQERRVKVLPILLANCPLPAFLRDKIYADFRVEGDYDTALNLLVRAINAEFSNLKELEKAKSRLRASGDDNPEVANFMAAIEQHPLARTLRTALDHKLFTSKLTRIILQQLARMRKMTFDLDNMTDVEYPALAAIVVTFFRDLRSIDHPPIASLDLCQNIAEHEEVATKWRKMALARISHTE